MFSDCSPVCQEDESFLAAALRESNEELAIRKELVELLGEVGPPTHSLNRLWVLPFVVCRLMNTCMYYTRTHVLYKGFCTQERAKPTDVHG